MRALNICTCKYWFIADCSKSINIDFGLRVIFFVAAYWTNDWYEFVGIYLDSMSKP